MVNYSWISVLPNTIQKLMLTKVIEGRQIKKNGPKTDICFPQWFDLVASFSQILGVWGLLGRRHYSGSGASGGVRSELHNGFSWCEDLLKFSILTSTTGHHDWIVADISNTKRAEVTWPRPDYDGVCFREPAFVVRLKSFTWFAFMKGATWSWVSLYCVLLWDWIHTTCITGHAVMHNKEPTNIHTEPNFWVAKSLTWNPKSSKTNNMVIKWRTQNSKHTKDEWKWKVSNLPKMAQIRKTTQTMVYTPEERRCSVCHGGEDVAAPWDPP